MFVTITDEHFKLIYANKFADQVKVKLKNNKTIIGYVTYCSIDTTENVGMSERNFNFLTFYPSEVESVEFV